MATRDWDAARRAKERHQWDLLAMDGVRSVGIGRRERDNQATDEVVVRVGVEAKRRGLDRSSDDFVRPEIDDGDVSVGVDVVEVGRLQLLAPDPNRYRPVIGGARYTRGTVTGIATDRRDGRTVYIGANHCMVPSVWSGQTFSGDPAVLDSSYHFQPDSGPANVVGRPKRLASSAVLGQGILLSTDAAIASLYPGDSITPAVDAIPWVADIGGGPATITDPVVGQRVRIRQAMSGRVLEAEVVESDTWFKPDWRVQQGSVMRQVVVMNSFALRNAEGALGIPGDSGSPVYDADSATAVGLLSAASSTNPYGLACTMRSVFADLDLVPYRCGRLRSLLGSALRLRPTIRDGASVDEAEARLRPLLDEVLPSSPSGRALLDAVLTGPDPLVDALGDNDAFGLTTRLVAPFVSAANLFEALEVELSPPQIEAAHRLAERLEVIESSAAPVARQLADWLASHLGHTLRDLLAGAEPSLRL